MKSLMLSALAIATLLPGTLASVRADERREEWRDHPRIVKAVHELEDAVKYMDAAPNDFGGHKAAAIAASREAIRQLRAAINYRAEHDERH
jgi:hypothetical protein